MVPNQEYSGCPKPQLEDVKFLPFTCDAAEYNVLKAGQVNIGYIPEEDLPPKPANSVLPATNPVGATHLQPYYALASTTPRPTSTTRTWASCSGSSTCGRPSDGLDQPGIDKAINRGTPSRTKGRPVAAREQVATEPGR